MAEYTRLLKGALVAATLLCVLGIYWNQFEVSLFANAPTSSLRVSDTAPNRTSLPLPDSTRIKFYILPLTELTTDLVNSYPAAARDIYQKLRINEDAGEVWLHRGFERHPDRTWNQSEASVVIIPAYLHLNYYLKQRGIATEDGPLTLFDPGHPLLWHVST